MEVAKNNDQTASRMAGSNETYDPRLELAAERTLLAWIRTGVALMGFGFVVARFGYFLRELAAVEHRREVRPGYSLWFGGALIVIGVLTQLIAAGQHVRLIRRFQGHVSEQPRVAWLALSVTGLLAALGIALAAYLLTLGN